MVKKINLLQLVLLGFAFTWMAADCFADVAAQFEQAGAYEDQDQYEQAEAVYQAIQKAHQGTEDALEAKGRLVALYIEWGKQKQADKVYQQLLNKFTRHTDQGSQFTSDDFTIILKEDGIQISMDGKGRVFDNIFVERLWRTVKTEEVYLRDYQAVTEAAYNLGRYFELYNNRRLHQALGYCTPAEVYGVAVGTPVALRAPSVPTALTDGDKSTLKTLNVCLYNG